MSKTSVSGHIQSSESLVDFDFNDVSTEIVLIGKFVKWVTKYSLNWKIIVLIIVSNGNENIQMPSSIAPNLSNIFTHL